MPPVTTQDIRTFRDPLLSHLEVLKANFIRNGLVLVFEEMLSLMHLNLGSSL